MAPLEIHSGARYPLVPLMVVVTLLTFCPTSFARPKSAICGASSESNNKFSGLMSQCMMRSQHLSWRYSNPLAIPMAMPYLVFQLRVLEPF
ncbi:hypothetical protein BT93_L4327 [Corymbia citriodora subsp. variegata]|uniref:Secreted protein n=1 Tax=Corymbia citriodora subsp. variegata TaxID=360336 RepID=A0A8T0CUT0_CORYI|nr:hypothetical protein BT93_L4327 [Corymbia citriodora subsp. variegata]